MYGSYSRKEGLRIHSITGIKSLVSEMVIPLIDMRNTLYKVSSELASSGFSVIILAIIHWQLFGAFNVHLPNPPRGQVEHLYVMLCEKLLSQIPSHSSSWKAGEHWANVVANRLPKRFKTIYQICMCHILFYTQSLPTKVIFLLAMRCRKSWDWVFGERNTDFIDWHGISYL